MDSSCYCSISSSDDWFHPEDTVFSKYIYMEQGDLNRTMALPAKLYKDPVSWNILTVIKKTEFEALNSVIPLDD